MVGFIRKRRDVGGTDLTRLKDRAAKCVARGDWKNALRALLIAQDHFPTDSYIARKIGEVYQRMGKVGQAVEAYKHAARLYAEEGFLYKAISVNKIILSLHPEDAEVRDALMALHSKRSEERLVDLQECTSGGDGNVSRVVGVYLDRVSKETLLWIPLISELKEEDVGRVIDSMVRKKKRLNIMRRVDYQYEGRSKLAYTRDLSRGGMYLRARDIIPEETELDFTVRLNEDQPPEVVRGQVVRTNPLGDQRGFGVRFFQEGQEPALQRISAFVLTNLREAAQKRLAKNPEDLDSLYLLAEIAREESDWDQTELYLRKITGIKSPSVAHGFLGEVLLHKALRTGDESLSKEAQAMFDIALQLSRDQELETAHHTLKKRIDRHRNSTPPPAAARDDGLFGLEIDVVDTDIEDLSADLEPIPIELEEEVDPGPCVDQSIAEELAARTEALDQREARLAKLEQELLDLQKVLRAQQDELTEREARLKDQAESIDQRTSEMNAREDELLCKEQELIERTEEEQSSASGETVDDL